MSYIKGPLISSQRYLDKAKVNDRAARFKRFIVSVYPIVLRGQQYTILMDGHH
ncbi:chromosome partitioning protein ParB, partial [Salmonella enterica]|nr:chromosome partitioning protein ParB [Salmonella enterica]